jgi:P-type Ca2+ transporter type 2C
MCRKELAISLVLGFVALLPGVLICLTPDEPCERIFIKVRLLPKPEMQPTMLPDAEPGFGFAMDRVRDNLGRFSKLRGGRMRSPSFARKSRLAAHNPSTSCVSAARSF